jgi:hypothetical protein
VKPEAEEPPGRGEHHRMHPPRAYRHHLREEVNETKAYEPWIRARFGTTAHEEACRAKVAVVDSELYRSVQLSI